MPVTPGAEGHFFTYTMPAEAQDFDLGSFYESRGNLSTQRNTQAVDWVRRKWYRVGYRWLADYSDIEGWGLWVGDLDNLTDFSWLPFGTATFDPASDPNFSTFVGLVAFQNTKYLAIGVSYDSNDIDHLLIDADTGNFVASAIGNRGANHDNNELAPFVLPTADPNVFHRYDNSDVATNQNTRWAVIKYDLSAETVTVLVDYALVSAALDGAEKRYVALGREGSTFNTVFQISDVAGDGVIREVTIPHNTAGAGDLSVAEIVAVSPIDGSANQMAGIYYDQGLDRIVYSYRVASGFIVYTAVARTAPSTVIWTTTVAATFPFQSGLNESSYIQNRMTGCTCVDLLESNVIDITTGTVTKAAEITTDVQGLRFDLIDMESNQVWGSFKQNKPFVDLRYDPNNFAWPALDPGDEAFVNFVQAYRSALDLFYPAGACVAEEPEPGPCPIPGLGSEACITGRTAIPPGYGQILCGQAEYVDPCA